MPAPYVPQAVANIFLQKSIEGRHPVDHMKLQKLVYFTHGLYLAATALDGPAQPLVNEYFEAWEYGPVCPGLYREFAEFGRDPITRLGLAYAPEFGTRVAALTHDADPILKSVSDHVWVRYGDKRSMELSNLTHKVGGAWDRARQEAKGLRGKDIPNEYILEDFKPFVHKKAG